MLRYLPGAILAGRISYETANSSAFSAKLWPARSARTFASTSSGGFFKRSLIHASAGGVHRDQHVEVVAGREHLVRGEAELEGAHAGERAGGGADLGREVGQGGEVVARQRRLGGELHAGHLHAVARVAGEADDDRVARLDALARARHAVQHWPSIYSVGGARLQFLSAALSVVVPTLDEAEALPATLAAARQPGVCEVIVVDGGSRDGTLAVARPLADRVLRAPRGRAQQMNAGAAAARADVLLFLHADTRLPAGYAQAVAGALADPAVVGGRFDVRLDAAGFAYRALGRLISLRSRLTRVATGDQAIFVRRAVFEHLGGYPLVPLMEDVALSRALKRAGRIACLG